MDTNNKLSVIEDELNIKLFNMIVKFIEKDVEYSAEKNIFLNKFSKHLLYLKNFQMLKNVEEEYEIHYIGELLERYNEKGIIKKKDIRALVLAVGVTEEIHTENMFVGQQKEDFIKKIYRSYNKDFDVYLGLGLYLMVDQNTRNKILHDFYDRKFSNIGQIIMVLTISDDSVVLSNLFETFFIQFYDLFTTQRNISVIGNEDIYAFFISKMFDIFKTSRKKEYSFFKALCSLSNNRVHKDTRQFEILVENGYLPIEVAYLNYSIPASLFIKDSVKNRTIVYQKIVADYCIEAISNHKELTNTERVIVEELLNKYKEFKIKCNGYEHIKEIISSRSKINNEENYFWLINLDKTLIPRNISFFEIDYLDENNHSLIKRLSKEQNINLFNHFALGLTDKDKVIKSIEYLLKITAIDFIKEIEFNYYYYDIFNSFIDYDVIDLSEYLNRMNEENKNLNRLLYSYIKTLKNKKIFNFIIKFDKKHKIENFKKYFEHHFYEIFNDNSRYRSNIVCVNKIYNEFLTYKEIAKTIELLDKSIFLHNQSCYIEFIKALLKNEYTIKYLEKDVLRNISLMVIDDEFKSSEYDYETYKKYLETRDIIKIDKKNNEQKKSEESNKKMKLLKNTIEYVQSKFDGTFQSLYNLIEYKYLHFSKEREVLIDITIGITEEIIKKCNALTKEEFSTLCHICLTSFETDKMDVEKLFSIIKNAKELVQQEEGVCNE